MQAANVSRITETILSLELAINERWNKGDVDGALEMYSEDVTYFDPLTEVRLDGRKAVEAPTFASSSRASSTSCATSSPTHR